MSTQENSSAAVAAPLGAGLPTTPATSYAALNEKYGQFIVTRWSTRTYRNIQVGRAVPTIEEALRKAFAADKRHPSHGMHFVDVAPAAIAKASA